MNKRSIVSVKPRIHEIFSFEHDQNSIILIICDIFQLLCPMFMVELKTLCDSMHFSGNWMTGIITDCDLWPSNSVNETEIRDKMFI